MFNLEQSISDWRKQTLAAGIKSPVPLDELEIHLREEMERQMKLGLSEQKAFEISVQKIGDTNMLKDEFKKVGAENWNRPLARVAWILFAVSFFLPACNQLWGWQCACLSIAILWGNGAGVYLAAMTLANLFMVASIFLILRFSQNNRVMKWLRLSSLAALILVWSYVFGLIATGGGPSLKIGCYVWTISFLLLCLSTLKMHSRKTNLRKEQYV